MGMFHTVMNGGSGLFRGNRYHHSHSGAQSRDVEYIGLDQEKLGTDLTEIGSLL